MQSYHRVHVQLHRKDRQKVVAMLSRGQESARVLRRASILRHLDSGQKVALLGGSMKSGWKIGLAVPPFR